MAEFLQTHGALDGKTLRDRERKAATGEDKTETDGLSLCVGGTCIFMQINITFLFLESRSHSSVFRRDSFRNEYL